jgi:hypothetical protein
MKRVALVILRLFSGAAGLLLVLMACRTAFETAKRYRYPSFLDTVPRFTLAGEFELWLAIVGFLVGGIYLSKSAITGSWRLMR